MWIFISTKWNIYFCKNNIQGHWGLPQRFWGWPPKYWGQPWKVFLNFSASVNFILATIKFFLTSVNFGMWKDVVVKNLYFWKVWRKTMLDAKCKEPFKDRISNSIVNVKKKGWSMCKNHLGRRRPSWWTMPIFSALFFRALSICSVA